MFGIDFFLKGLLVGIFVSAPMGPVGVLCVQRTVSKGRIKGFFSGLGAATADTFYAFLAAFGISFVSNFLTENQKLFQIIGVSVLLFIGVRMILKNPIKEFRENHKNKHVIKKRHLVKDYIAVFFLTISNPLTILFFGAAFTMFGLLTMAESPTDSYLLVMGIFTGACLWWFFLTTMVARFKKRFNLRSMFVINRVSGIIILILTLSAIIKFFFLK